MPVSITEVVDEAIRYEHNLAALYHSFSSIFTDDTELWWELSTSEEEHAMLLESGRTLFKEEFARDTIPEDLDALRQSNESLETLLDEFEEAAPSREEAFRLTLDLEKDANEMTLHRILKIEKSQQADEIVTRIYDEDSAHAEKVLAYVNRRGISI
jgi:hypothetical protein